MTKELIFKLFCLSFIFCSCSRTLINQIQQEENLSSSASIIGDSIFYNDINKSPYWPEDHTVQFLYNSLFGLDQNSAYLKEGEECEFFITQPTEIWGQQLDKSIILYPGDKVIIQNKEFGDVGFVSSDATRTKELQNFDIFTEFLDKELPLGYSVKQYLSFQKDSSFFEKNDSSILENDKVMRLQLNDLRARIKGKIDSLVKVNNISKEFSKEMISYLSARIFSIKIDYFRFTKTFFTSGNMPEIRFTDLVSCSNTIRTQNELKYYYNQLRDLTKFITYSRGQIESIFDSASFQLFLHVVKDNFKGLVKNYLIADILYTALRNKVIGPTTAKMYANKECDNKIYKLILTKIAERSGKLEKYASTKDGEFLLPFASKKPVTEDDLLKHYKGKLVLVDFWSSWCIPCRRELPLMIELKRQYTGKDIVFLTISIDKEFLEWQRANKTEELSPEGSFVMGTNDSVFVFKGNLIESIPRYLLFNRDGSLIDANAPSPGTQALKEMIDKYLKD